MIITLVEATATRLRYKAHAQNNSSGESGVITNNPGGVAGTDLALDSFASSALRALVRTAAASQAAARQLLQGEGLTAPGDAATPRAHVRKTEIHFDTTFGQPCQWIINVDTGAALDGDSTGFACIQVSVTGDGVAGGEVYIDVEIM